MQKSVNVAVRWLEPLLWAIRNAGCMLLQTKHIEAFGDRLLLVGFFRSIWLALVGNKMLNYRHPPLR